MVNDATIFWSRVTEDPSGCWLWTGTIDRQGYGSFRLAGATVRAHRFAYEEMVASIPAELVLDHLCRVRHCVNPEHLEPVPNAVNVMRGESFAVVNAGASHCPKGHPYADSNLRIDGARGWRQCRTCRNAAARDYYRDNAERLQAKARERMRRRRSQGTQQPQAG